MDLIERRAYLSATQNPDKNLDYIITLKGHPPKCTGPKCTGHKYAGQAYHITLRYVPDRSVLDAQAFGNYLDATTGAPWNTPEDLAVTVLGDVNDKIIPRWIQLALSIADPHYPCLDSHEIILEDRQPGWDNSDLFGRLARI